MHFRNITQNLLLYFILLFLIAFVAWASTATINESVVASGQVIASSKTQYIQSLEGGILEKVHVEEGAVVQKDQDLVKLSDVRFSTNYEESNVKYYALGIKVIRLKAEERNDKEVMFPASLIKDYPDLVKNEANSFYANRKKFKSKVNTLDHNIKIVSNQYNNFLKLEKDGVIPRIELIKVQKELNDLRGKLAYEKNNYYSAIKDQISDAETEAESLKEVISGHKDRLDRTLLKSPVYGIVKKISISNVGAIIKSGDTIIEIVPLGEELLVEGKILPNKIAFINPNQDVNISISAYDTSVYGTLKGNIKYISADTIIEKDQSGKEQSFYKVVVKSKSNNIEYKGKLLPIIPGMQADVHIVTGQRTVMQYILKPLIKAKLNAFNEK